MVSVQVHPRDTQADLLPAGETGKTEAWIVLEAGTQSRIYAGLEPDTTAAARAKLDALDGQNLDETSDERSLALGSGERRGQVSPRSGPLPSGKRP
jgi:mannose-6-phosphate isomerase class I